MEIKVEEMYERVREEYDDQVAERFRKEAELHVQKDGTLTFTDALDAKDRALLNGSRPIKPAGFSRITHPHPVTLRTLPGIYEVITNIDAGRI